MSGGLDSYTAAAIAKSEGFELYALTILLRPAARARGRIGARRGAGAGRRASSRAADRPARHRRIVADLGRERARATAISRRPIFRRPTCRRATPSSCRWRSAGPKCSRRPTSSSASTRSTIPAIRTAGRSSSARSSRWRAGHARGRRRRASPDPHSAHQPHQGRDHPPGPRARPGLRPDTQLLRSGARRPALRTVRQLRAAGQGIRRGGRGRSAGPALRSHRSVRFLNAQPLRRQIVVTTCALLLLLAGAIVWSANRTRAERQDEVRQETRFGRPPGSCLSEPILRRPRRHGVGADAAPGHRRSRSRRNAPSCSRTSSVSSRSF